MSSHSYIFENVIKFSLLVAGSEVVTGFLGGVGEPRSGDFGWALSAASSASISPSNCPVSSASSASVKSTGLSRRSSDTGNSGSALGDDGAERGGPWRDCSVEERKSENGAAEWEPDGTGSGVPGAGSETVAWYGDEKGRGSGALIGVKALNELSTAGTVFSRRCSSGGTVPRILPPPEGFERTSDNGLSILSESMHRSNSFRSYPEIGLPVCFLPTRSKSAGMTSHVASPLAFRILSITTGLNSSFACANVYCLWTVLILSTAYLVAFFTHLSASGPEIPLPQILFFLALSQDHG